MKADRSRRRMAGVAAAALAVGFFLPASLAEAAGGRGGRPGTAVTQVTEDNDTNDGVPNNVVDEGDNRHPSGRDRSVEHGASGNQGRSSSDPDDDGRGPDRTNGGADKPGGPGGVDLADQDANNGCGNDDDFEDDNEGLCLGKPRQPVPPTTVVPATTTTTTAPEETGRVEVCKVAGPGVTAGTPFTFTVGTITAVVKAGECRMFHTGLPDDAHVLITEAATTGVEVASITVTPSERLIGSPNLAAGTVTVEVCHDVTKAVFTNQVVTPTTTTTTTVPASTTTTTVPASTTTTTVPASTTTTTVPASTTTTTVPASTTTTTTTTAVAGTVVAQPAVLGTVVERQAEAAPAAPRSVVLGASHERGAALARTGSDASTLVAMSIAFLTLGGLLALAGRRRSV